MNRNSYIERAEAVDRNYSEEAQEVYVQHRSGEVFKVLGRLFGAKKPYHKEGWNGQPTMVLEDRDGNQIETSPDNPNFKRL